MFVLTVLTIQKLVELLQSLFTSRLIFFHYCCYRFAKPGRQLPYLHIVVELNQTDIGNSIESQATESWVSGQKSIGMGDVERYVLPNLHINFLYIQVLEGVVYQV